MKKILFIFICGFIVLPKVYSQQEAIIVSGVFEGKWGNDRYIDNRLLQVSVQTSGPMIADGPGKSSAKVLNEQDRADQLQASLISSNSISGGFGCVVDGKTSFTSNNSKDFYYDIDLFPGMDFTGSWYFWVNGSSPATANLSENPQVDWLSITPEIFTAYPNNIAIKVDYHFVAPSLLGIYTTTIVDLNGTWDQMIIRMNVTNTPCLYTYVQSFNIQQGQTFTYTYKPTLPYYFEWGGIYYYPSSGYVKNYENPDVDWLTINPVYSIMNPGDTLLVDYDITCQSQGLFNCYTVGDFQYYSYPEYFYFDVFCGNYPSIQAFGYNSSPHTSTLPKGPLSFSLENPQNMTSIANQSALNALSAGTWCNGGWYGAVFTENNLIKINPSTGIRTVIGYLGVEMEGLSYDYSTSTLYGVNWDAAVPGQSALFTINTQNATKVLKGSTSNGELLVNLAASPTGELFAVDILNDNLGKVNKITGAFTPIGYIGFDANYAQDMEFNHYSGRCYMAAYNNTLSKGELRLVNTATGMSYAIGDFDGGMDVTGLAIPYNPAILNIKAFLEGPFSGSTMLSFLNIYGYLPTSQPFNQPPWNYLGTESVTSIPNSNVVDWVLLELRETAGGASTATSSTMIAQQAAFILKNGTIVRTDGVNKPFFNVQVTQNLYLVIWHRNHLGIMSSSPLTQSGGIYSYDFTTGAAKVYGGSLGHKQLTTNIWGMIAGDGDANRNINNIDKNDVWRPQSGSSGYKSGDYNMSGGVDNVDKLDYWAPNSGRSCQVPL